MENETEMISSPAMVARIVSSRSEHRRRNSIAQNSKDINADFDMWIKMATDNKINVKNTWDFALIDYFQDLTFMRDGSKINFQKASATLDGCMKIYSSRIDSAAKETSSLLTGLTSSANNGSQHTRTAEEEGDDEEEEDLHSAGFSALQGRSKARSTHKKSNLLPFDQLKGKIVGPDLGIDGMFKKALADADEGGARSLLLNILCIDEHERVVFETDSSLNSKVDLAIERADDNEIDPESWQKLEKFIMPNQLQSCTLSPSLYGLKELAENFEALQGANGPIIEDLRVSTEMQDSIELHDHQFWEDIYDPNEVLNSDNALARSAQNASRGISSEGWNIQEPNSFGLRSDITDKELIEYFDKTLKDVHTKSLNWKIKNLMSSRGESPPVPTTKLHKPHKSVVMVDFFTIEDSEESLFEKGKSIPDLPSRTISNDQDIKNFLSEDYQFTAKRLTSLFSKPSVSQKFNQIRTSQVDVPADQMYWSQKYNDEHSSDELERSRRLEDIFNQDMDELHQSYDYSFFQDAVSTLTNIDLDANTIKGASGLITGDHNTTNINFAKVAKRVDVKLLKSNLLECLKKKNIISGSSQAELDTKKLEHTSKQSQLGTANFSKVVQSVREMYSAKESQEMSTSFCFICLLHLANENGFSMDSSSNNSDIIIKSRNA